MFNYKSNSFKHNLILLFVLFALSCKDLSKDQSQLDSTTSSSGDLSSNAIINSTLDELRSKIKEQNLDYAVDITSVAGKTIDEITGEKELTKAQNDSIQGLLLHKNDIDKNATSDYIVVNGKQLLPTMSRLDLRDYGLITSIKDQNPAGSCWAFGAMSAFESNYNIVNSLKIDASEQYVINCSGAGTANNGGLAFQVFQWMIDKGKNVDDEASSPYEANDLPCRSTQINTNYYAVEWQFIDPSQNPSVIPTVQQIKDAICKYGAISASVYVSSDFQYYKFRSSEPTKSYIFKENRTFSGTNHAISLIGWDDSKNAWILKNSWGTGWGITCSQQGEAAEYRKENAGYMWIDYNTNNIGRRALWVRARKTK